MLFFGNEWMTVKWLVGLGMKAERQRRAVLSELYSVKTLAEFLLRE